MAHIMHNNKFQSANKPKKKFKFMNISQFLMNTRTQKIPKNIYFQKDLDIEANDAELVPIISFVRTVGSFIASNKSEYQKKPILTDYVISEIHTQLKRGDHRLMDIPVSVFLRVDTDQYWKEYGLIRIIKKPDNLILVGAEMPKLKK